MEPAVRTGAVYKYYCRSCKKYFDNGYKPYVKRDEYNCPYCNSTDAKRVGQKAFKIGEPHEGHDGISTRSDAYWENAEANRLARAKKQQQEEMEKLQYDKDYKERVEAARVRRDFDDEED